MGSWGSNNDSSSYPAYLDGNLVKHPSVGYSNNYANGTSQNSVWGVVASQAAGKHSYAQGWVYVKRGTGGVGSITITAGGTGYANTDKWALTGGSVQANGTLSTNSTGGITSTVITNTGAGFLIQGANVAIANSTGGASAGSGAQLQVVLNGKGGRVAHETLVAMASMTTANSANDYVNMP